MPIFLGVGTKLCQFNLGFIKIISRSFYQVRQRFNPVKVRLNIWKTTTQAGDLGKSGKNKYRWLI